MSDNDERKGNKKEKKTLRVNCIVVDGGAKEYGELIGSYLHCQHALNDSLDLVFYCMSY
jgi:hypothetical protein